MAKQQSNKKAKTRSENNNLEHSWARHGRYEGKCSVAGLLLLHGTPVLWGAHLASYWFGCTVLKFKKKLQYSCLRILTRLLVGKSNLLVSFSLMK